MATTTVTLAATSASYAADSVNVAFFLEWGTPNQISKVDKAYANINLAKLSFKMGDKKSAQSLIKQVINENSDNFDIIQLAEQANGEILVK